MSKMSSEFVRQAESRSLDNAEEVERLRAEVARLGEIIAASAIALNRGCPFRVLGQVEDALRDCRMEIEADQVVEFVADLRAAMAILAP